MIFLFNWVIFRFHVNFPGSNTAAALKRCNGPMRHDRVTDFLAASLRPFRRVVGDRRLWLGTCRHDINGYALTIFNGDALI